MAIVSSTSDSVRTSTAPVTGLESVPWQQIIKGAIRDPNELRRRLGLPLVPDQDEASVAAAHQQFRTFVPEPFLSRIRLNDPNDPLLRQVLPVAEEAIEVDGFRNDAVGDMDATRQDGLIHKYQGRALLITSGVCAVNCRYCFRRHFPYETAPRSEAEFDRALAIIRGDESIREVILSGGDPLMLTDDRLKCLIDSIAAIGHIDRLRIHTRLPIVVPQRVTGSLVKMLRNMRPATFVVLHINHPNEIDSDVEKAIESLLESKSMLLNQSVLLRGVNDDATTLIELSERLVALRCIPYYLHQLDRVQGAAHFEVPVEQGLQLIQEMRNALPGYAVPRYVTEIAGEPCKRLLGG